MPDSTAPRPDDAALVAELRDFIEWFKKEDGAKSHVRTIERLEAVAERLSRGGSPQDVAPGVAPSRSQDRRSGVPEASPETDTGGESGATLRDRLTALRDKWRDGYGAQPNESGAFNAGYATAEEQCADELTAIIEGEEQA